MAAVREAPSFSELAVRRGDTALLIEEVVDIMVDTFFEYLDWLIEDQTDEGRPPFAVALSRRERLWRVWTATPEDELLWQQQFEATPDSTEKRRAQAEHFELVQSAKVAKYHRLPFELWAIQHGLPAQQAMKGAG